jgi:hemerythrin-like domain-containing protein
MQPPESGHTPARLDELLKSDHAALEVTFRRMIGKFGGGDPDAIRAGWQAMEQQLETHLGAEEQFMLPRFEKAYPEEAERIRVEHKQIRAALLQLGVDLDLHALRDETARAFIDALRQHAENEERLFYVWAQRELSHGERHQLLDRLRAVGERLAGG